MITAELAFLNHLLQASHLSEVQPVIQFFRDSCTSRKLTTPTQAHLKPAHQFASNQ